MATNGYHYVSSGQSPAVDRQKSMLMATDLSRARLAPDWSNPDYLLYWHRARNFRKCLDQLPEGLLDILDVGGRIQPYRPLVETRINTYIAVDPQMEGLVDIVARGESLPFRSDKFDFVICSQVLGYADSPQHLVTEILRVLKEGALLFLTVPALSPRHHDERWRFLPDGIDVLLKGFRNVEVIPEGYSFAGIVRTLNEGLNLRSERYLVKRALSRIVFPATNWTGMKLDKLGRHGEHFTANYSVIAIK